MFRSLKKKDLDEDLEVVMKKKPVQGLSEVKDVKINSQEEENSEKDTQRLVESEEEKINEESTSIISEGEVVKNTVSNRGRPYSYRHDGGMPGGRPRVRGGGRLARRARIGRRSRPPRTLGMYDRGLTRARCFGTKRRPRRTGRRRPRYGRRPGRVVVGRSRRDPLYYDYREEENNPEVVIEKRRAQSKEFYQTYSSRFPHDVSLDIIEFSGVRIEVKFYGDRLQTKLIPSFYGYFSSDPNRKIRLVFPSCHFQFSFINGEKKLSSYLPKDIKYLEFQHTNFKFLSYEETGLCFPQLKHLQIPSFLSGGIYDPDRYVVDSRVQDILLQILKASPKLTRFEYGTDYNVSNNNVVTGGWDTKILAHIRTRMKYVHFVFTNLQTLIDFLMNKYESESTNIDKIPSGQSLHIYSNIEALNCHENYERFFNMCLDIRGEKNKKILDRIATLNFKARYYEGFNSSSAMIMTEILPNLKKLYFDRSQVKFMGFFHFIKYSRAEELSLGSYVLNHWEDKKTGTRRNWNNREVLREFEEDLKNLKNVHLRKLQVGGYSEPNGLFDKVIEVCGKCENLSSFACQCVQVEHMRLLNEKCPKIKHLKIVLMCMNSLDELVKNQTIETLKFRIIVSGVKSGVSGKQALQKICENMRNVRYVEFIGQDAMSWWYDFLSFPGSIRFGNIKVLALDHCSEYMKEEYIKEVLLGRDEIKTVYLKKKDIGWVLVSKI